jgi:hypothetical protein
MNRVTFTFKTSIKDTHPKKGTQSRRPQCYSITKHPGKFGHIRTRVCGARFMVVVGFPRQKKASADRKCRQPPRFTAFSQRFTAISIHGANCLVSFQRCASARCPHAVMTRMSSGDTRIRVKTFNRRIENRLLHMSTSEYPILLLPVLSKCDT